MSYILDALKKNQLEQDGDTHGLQAFQPNSGRKIPQWLLLVLGIAVLSNVVLLGWIFLSEDTPAQPVPAVVQQDPPPQVSPTPAAQPSAAVPERPAPASASAATPAAPPTQMRNGATPAQAAQSPPAQIPPAPPAQPGPAQPSPAQSSPARSSAAQSPPVKKPAVLQLRELSDKEQTLYNGFNYTSHIYTDDPSECAIVIDGQRLRAGESFKGLKVIRITEAGVVFAENRRGRVRHVEVSVVEQWDRAS